MYLKEYKKAVDLSDKIKELNVSSVDLPCDTVVVTGYAEYTPLGDTKKTAEAEFKGVAGTKRLDVKNFRSNLAGTIDFKPEEHFTEKELRGMSRIGALGVALAKEAGQMSGLLDENFKLKKGIDPLKAGCTVSSGIGATSKMVEVNEKIYWKVDAQTGKFEPRDPKIGSSLLNPFIGLQLFPEEMGGRY